MSRTSGYIFGSNRPEEVGYGKPSAYFDQPVDTPTTEFQAQFSEQLTNSACRLAALRPTYLVRPLPEMPVDVPKIAARQAMLGKPKQIQIPISEYQARHKLVWQAQDTAVERCGAKVLDPLPILCEAGFCAGVKQGRPLYYDSHHLSEFGNKQLVPMFQLVFQ